MNIKKSICTNLVFPRSRKESAEFRRAAAFLKEHGVDSLEFYHDGPGKKQIGRILEENKLEGIYIGVIPSKEQKLHACSVDEENRRRAVELFESCMDEAAADGISILMINSGAIGPSVQGGLEALKESIRELYNYIEKKRYSMRLTLEPCDSWMFAKQLLGPAARTAAFVKSCRKEGLPLKLTMDSAHTLEEGEDFLEALEQTREWCSHIHFANCCIRDSASSMYGDQHVGFECPQSEWGYEEIFKAWPRIAKLYENRELRVAIEVLCRSEDPYSYFESMWQRMPYVQKSV